uniref:Putative cytochrome P450 n=1 Tax=Moniliophthora roreri TaxID=221103 RepID=A0A0W0EWR5_MONRR
MSSNLSTLSGGSPPPPDSHDLQAILHWWGPILFALFVLGYFNSTFTRKNVPRGPIGFPIVGSFPFMTHYPELALHRWYKKYGDMYSLQLGNQLFLVLSDPGVIKDLMIAKGAIVSSRKDMFIKAQTIFQGRAITGSQYGDRWRKHRRIAYSYIQQRSVDEFTPILERESFVLVKTLYEDSKGGLLPVNPQRHAGRCLLNNMLAITFGIRTDALSDPMVSEVLRISREFMNCTGPVSNLVDFVPFLQRIPTPMQKRGARLREDTIKLYGGMIKDMERRLQAGEDVPDCLAKKLLEIRAEEELNFLDITMLTVAFMIAGVETPAGLIQWFAAHISRHPEIQKKAHEELDRVVGRDRLPTHHDQAQLHFCRAIIKEVQRQVSTFLKYHNPFWLGTPHAVTEDFTYRGYSIPKDTVVICNTYSLHFNEQRYPDPYAFNPDRYVDDMLNSAESANLSDPYKRDHWMFGVGRRICIGMLLADRELFLAMSRMLWAFNMAEIPEEPIDLKEYDGLSGRSPVPYRISLQPRHEGVAQVLVGTLRQYLGSIIPPSLFDGLKPSYIIPDTIPFYVASTTLPSHLLQDVEKILRLRLNIPVPIYAPMIVSTITLAAEEMQHSISSYRDLAFLIPDNYQASETPPPKFLVFFDNIKATEGATRFLQTRLSPQHSDKVKWFHATMTPAYRENTFDNFRKGKLFELIVTDAFGMDLDLPNVEIVRFGRAARGTGIRAVVVLLHDSELADAERGAAEERAGKRRESDIAASLVSKRKAGTSDLSQSPRKRAAPASLTTHSHPGQLSSSKLSASSLPPTLSRKRKPPEHRSSPENSP